MDDLIRRVIELRKLEREAQAVLAAGLLSFRRQHGIGQADLARQCGLSPQYICDIEKGRRPLSNSALNALLQAEVKL